MSQPNHFHIKAASSDGFRLINNLEIKNKPLEKWVEELAQYERMLEGMTKANLASNFKEEMNAVENWFDALEEEERTASLYTMVHKCSPVLVRFLITVLQKIAKSQDQNQALPTFSDCFRSISSTSIIPMLKSSDSSSSNSSTCSSTEVSNVLPEDWKPTRSFKSKPNSLDIKSSVHWGQRELTSKFEPNSVVHNQNSPWRSKLYPKSLKSPSFPPGLTSWNSTDIPFPNEKPMNPIDFTLLKDIPQWMRSLRLHKYTPLFEKMLWQDIVNLNDEKLSAMGVAALGARRKFLKVFDQVKKEAELKGTVMNYPSEPPSPLSESHISYRRSQSCYSSY